MNGDGWDEEERARRKEESTLNIIKWITRRIDLDSNDENVKMPKGKVNTQHISRCHDSRKPHNNEVIRMPFLSLQNQAKHVKKTTAKRELELWKPKYIYWIKFWILFFPFSFFVIIIIFCPLFCIRSSFDLLMILLQHSCHSLFCCNSLLAPTLILYLHLLHLINGFESQRQRNEFISDTHLNIAYIKYDLIYSRGFFYRE